MKKYVIPITLETSVTVEAEDAEDAVDIVNAMEHEGKILDHVSNGGYHLVIIDDDIDEAYDED